MIHSVYTPCHPGGDCCDDCRGHHHLGEAGPAGVTCDDNGQCYEVTSTVSYDNSTAPFTPLDTSGSTLPPLTVATAAPTVGTTTGAFDKTSLLYIGGALLLVLLLEGASTDSATRRRRR